MADTPNTRASSIIDEAFSLFNNENSTRANEVLMDPNAREVLAVSNLRGNDLTEKPGLGKDLTDMSYGELLVTYGPEVADNQIRLRNTARDVQAVDSAERTTAQATGDSLNAAAGGFTSLLGNSSALLFMAAGAADRAVDPTKTGFTKLGVKTAQATGDVVDWLSDFQSKELQGRKRISQIEAQLDSKESFDQFLVDIDAGKDPFLAGLQAVGRDFMDTGERILNDGAIAGDVVAQSIGSLGPSAKFASFGGKMAADLMARGTSNAVAQSVARTAGIAAGVGVSEASGTYGDTVDKVMSMDQATLEKSPLYEGLIAEGYTPESARYQIAGLAGEAAFLRQLPTAAAIGLISSKFDAAPIGSFRGVGIAEGLRTILSQGIEETLQSGFGQYNQNVAIQTNADPNQSLMEGVGEQAASGAIGGLGMAGGMAIPGTVMGTPAAISDAVKSLLGGEQSFNDSLTQSIMGKDSRGQQIVNAGRAASEAVQGAVAPVVQAAKDRATAVDKAGMNAGVQAARETVLKAQEAVAQGNVTPELQKTVEPDSTPIPEGLIEDTGSFIGNVSQLAETLSDTGFRPTESHVAYAASQFVKLKNMLPSLPADMQKNVISMMRSPQVMSTLKKAATLDLNKTQSVETTPVDANTVATTVSIAQTNPANVNPEVVNKILQQSGENISPENVKILQSASKIAQVVNQRADNEVTILNDRQIGLSRKNGTPVTDAPKTKESVTRSIMVSGYKNTEGKDLRSVNDFAADIFQGAQSPDGTLFTKDGQIVSVNNVMTSFQKLVQHLNNKVTALNESFDLNNEKGSGPTVKYETLINGETFIPKTDSGAGEVKYHRGNPGSGAFARQVHADAVAAAQVFNEIRTAFPEQFGSFPEMQIPDLKQDPYGFMPEEALRAEMDAQIAQEKADAIAAASERRIRKDAVLKTSESLIEQDAPSEKPTVLEETTSRSEVVDEQNQQTENDFLKNDKGEEVTFYHGTGGDQFTSFQDSKDGIFLTTRKGQGREFAIGKKNPRLMSVKVSSQNPLVIEAPQDMEPQDVWLAQRSKIESDYEKGGHDSIIIQKGDEAIVVVFNGNQIGILNQNVDNPSVIEPETIFEEGSNGEGTEALAEVTETVVSDEKIVEGEQSPADKEVSTSKPQIKKKVHESFDRAYQEMNSDPVVTSLKEYSDMTEGSDMNPVLVSVVKKIARPLYKEMNARVEKILNKTEKGVFGKTATVREHLKDGKIQALTRYRNLALVDPETGKYDSTLFQLGVIALGDWIATAQGRDPNQLDETLEDLGLSLQDLSKDDLENVLFGLPPSYVKDELARDILRMWNMQENPDATLADLTGIVEGFASEMLEALTQLTSNDQPMIEIADIPITLPNGEKGKTQTIKVKGLQTIQNDIKAANGKGTKMTAKEFLFGEQRRTYSIGEKIKGVANNQNRSKISLSPLEKAALRKMQDTPHFLNVGRSALFDAMGDDAMARLLGYDEKYTEIENEVLYNSAYGQALGVQKNINDVREMLKNLPDGETPVYYPVGVTKVGRHQYQGVNPQSNKLLRMLVSPAKSLMNLNNKEHMDLFWIGIAQAADLMKVEKNSPETVLSTVQGEFDAKYREATDMIKEWLKGGDLDGEALVSSILGKDSKIEPQVLAAIHTVAEMEFYKENGHETYETSLTFELDGLTNGAANMMVNYGQGLVSQQDMSNFQRIGFFLGKTGKTVNQYFSARGENGEKNYDLYEITSRRSQKAMFNNIRGMKPEDRARMMSAGRFAARFGNFKVTDKGLFEMTRNTAKNPMTKVNYGSGVQGVGNGLADDMILEFYKKAQGLKTTNQSLEDFFGYPEIVEDMQVLFGVDVSGGINPNDTFTPAMVNWFRNNISKSIGKTLTETTKSVIGDRITELNDMLVFSTNVQSQFLRNTFGKKLEELAEKHAKEGKIRRHPKTGKPLLSELTRRDYQSVVREMEKLAPIFVSDDQTLAIGGFSKAMSDLVLSSNMDGRLNQKALLPFPDEVGVKAIPFSVIGSGDAMMMNLIFGSEGAPEDALGIFDGLDIPFLKMQEYAPFVNQQVMKSWERDVLAMAVQNFKGFYDAIDGGSNPELMQAFQQVKDRSKNSSVKATTAGELLSHLQERHRLNKARKAVFKHIPVSVDQMGGSNVGYTRGEGEMSLAEINYQIQQEIDGKTQQEPEDVKIPVNESTVSAVLKGLRLTAEQSKVVEVLKEYLSDVQVITGTISQLNDYRRENFPDDGQILQDVPGQYDAQNGVIYLTSNNTETILHEMVHAATFSKVLDHFNGNTNEAVTRLEALMNEFLNTEFKGDRVNEAKASILRQKANVDPMSQAAAVNEFMAYALTNAQTKTALQGTETSLLKTLSQKVIQLMKHIMGGVPTSMFDHVLFNTKVLIEPPFDDGMGGDGNGNDGGDDSGGENTPESNGYTNFWIDMARDMVAQNAEKTKNLKQSAKPLNKFSDNANSIIESYRQVGMLNNAEARKTFKAIYILMAAQMKMDSKTVVSLTRMFQHIEENLTPEMFAGNEGNQAYSAVINSFGSYKNGNISDAVAVLLALSQTSKQFRAALDQVPAPEGGVSEDTLSEFLTQITLGTTRKLFDNVSIGGKDVLETMDNLAKSIADLDQEQEYRLLKKITSTFSALDQFGNGALSALSGWVKDKNTNVQASTRHTAVKVLVGSVTLGTNLLDKTNAALTADAAKTATHMNVPVASLVPIREFVSEVIGTDASNEKLMALQDKVNARISGMRQAYREDLPGILQNLFTTHPNAEQWSSMHITLGQTDFTRFVDPERMQQSMAYLEEGARRQQRISQLEQALDANLVPYVAQDAKDKAQQLANFMNGHGAGKLLMRNAYAIAKNLDGEFQPDLVDVLDELVTMYAIDQMDGDVREETVQLWQNEPKAMAGIITYIQGLNATEDSKVGISEQAKLNAYKGFIPNDGQKETRMTIAPTDAKHIMEQRGYTLVGSFEGDIGNMIPQSYYVTNVSHSGPYSQGVMQNVASTYRGVDINTGLTVTGATSGFISGDGSVDYIVRELNDPAYVQQDDKETLLPVFDHDGTVLGFERAINPDLYKKFMNQEQNLGVMMGAWAGRQVEEMLAAEYNRTLVDELDRLWQNREPGSDDMFENLKTTKDPIYAESFKLIPKGTKEYMDTKFDGQGPMVRKDMVNLSVGYREASLTDMWTGKTRLPKEVQDAVKYSTQFLLGKRAMGKLAGAERIVTGAVSTAKDVIVIRSLVVPAMNMKANVLQLVNNGVPVKQVMRGMKSKLAEVEEYQKNISKRIELEAKLRLAANNANQRRIIQSQIQVIDDLMARMTIAPMIEAGAFKNLSEGITDLDVSLSSGKFGDYMENIVSKMPPKVAAVGKVALVSKSTKIYKEANRATQYGDFLAKSIYYDHLISQGLSKDEAIKRINEEFVNFSFQPGRVRSAMERFGLSWFMAFKIRIMKIALRQIRENPFRSLAMNTMIPDFDGPILDNMLGAAIDGRLGYAIGPEMMLDAGSLNPWVNLIDG